MHIQMIFLLLEINANNKETTTKYVTASLLHYSNYRISFSLCTVPYHFTTILIILFLTIITLIISLPSVCNLILS